METNRDQVNGTRPDPDGVDEKVLPGKVECEGEREGKRGTSSYGNI